jgi:hypothetical protein
VRVIDDAPRSARGSYPVNADVNVKNADPSAFSAIPDESGVHAS